MILRALYDYQKRVEALGQSKPDGCSLVDIKFLIEIADDGTFHQLVDLREGKRGKEFLLPSREVKSGKNAYQKPNLMWETNEAILGMAKKGSVNQEKAQNQKEYFVKRVRSVNEIVMLAETQRAVGAVLAFYERNQLEALQSSPLFEDCVNLAGCNMTFRLSGETAPVAAMPEILEIAGRRAPSSEDVTGCCLVTGEKAVLAVLHPQTPIRGGQATGKLVGFQKNSGYDSYYKEQALNAPVSQLAARTYAEALNSLLASERNFFYLAGDSYVFWALPPKDEENLDADYDPLFDMVADFVGTKKEDDPNEKVDRMKSFLEHRSKGIPVVKEDGWFYLLGLSPNAARISIRLWWSGNVRDLVGNLEKHVEDSSVQTYKGKSLFSIYQMLCSITLDGNIDKLPPNMGGALLSSVTDGNAYPLSLFQRVIGRIRAERDVRPVWASIIRGTLNRYDTVRTEKEVRLTVALDEQNCDQAYVVGRLFAVLERIQDDALPNLNRTIRDRFYAAASATPATIFAHLLRLKKHHIKILAVNKPGWAIVLEQCLSQVMAMIQEFPLRLSLIEQGRFALGYYHQRQKFYEPSDKKDVETSIGPETANVEEAVQ